MNHLEKAVKLIRFHPDETWQHVQILDQSDCRDCSGKQCLEVCPSAVFQWSNEPDDPILVFYKQCVECGACRLVCNNVDFSYPNGGFGVMFREG
jgi:ferredoxin like protein